jgi:hypothetical protein
MRPPLTRSLRATLVLIMLPVLFSGAWSHAVADRPGPAGPHVEAAGTQRCPASHDEGRCLACQVLNLRVVVSHAVHVNIPESVGDGGCWQTAGLNPASVTPSHTQPRAPPAHIA